jgi:hypothetical protein
MRAERSGDYRGCTGISGSIALLAKKDEAHRVIPVGFSREWALPRRQDKESGYFASALSWL